MKLPLSDGADDQAAELVSEKTGRSIEQVPVDEVLFEIGTIVVMHLAVALSVVLTLRCCGIVGAG